MGKQEQLVISIKDFKGNIFWKSGDVHGNFKEKTFSAADTTWTITASWGAQLHPPYFQRLLIWFFGIGFLLTSLYTIRLFGKQTRYLEALIQRRTAELSIANEQLQVSEERQRKRIENSSAGYFFINSEGNYEYVNTAWLRMHKYDTAGEVIGKHYSLTQTDTDLKNAHKTVENLLDKESIITGEFSRLCKDKSIGYHTFTALPVKDKEKIL